MSQWQGRWRAFTLRSARSLSPGLRGWLRAKLGLARRDGAVGFALDRLAATVKVLPETVQPDDPGVLGLRALAERRYFHPRFSLPTQKPVPPDSTVVFASVCNDRYAPGLEALILSLKAIYPGLSCRYLVYHDGGLSWFAQMRLSSLYGGFEFRRRETNRYKVVLGDFANHKRIGLLGYLTLEALGERGASHLVILDADLLVLGDISALWTGDRIKAVPDIGVKPFGVVSRISGRPIVNSGVLGIPRNELGPAAEERRDAALELLATDEDLDIARFADQRFWNVYLRDRPVEYLPQNFNCIKTLVARLFPEEMGNVAILHMTGEKPWTSLLCQGSGAKKEHEGLTAREDLVPFGLWNSLYTRNLAIERITAFRSFMEERFRAIESTTSRAPIALIGNGPSIERTDLSAFQGYEKVVFHWFVLHPKWDELRPGHLVIASHELLGGWHTTVPRLPDEFLRALVRHSHCPRLWFPFYFKDYVETLPELRRYEVNYFLFERPLVRRAADSGTVQLDLRQPLSDAGTSVITVGMALAVLLRSETVVLAACDSTVEQAGWRPPRALRNDPGSRRTGWPGRDPGGEVEDYCFERARQLLAERGIALWDATVDGQRVTLPKLTIDQVRQWGNEPHSQGSSSR